MSFELWFTNILKIGFAVTGAHIIITRILPMLEDFLTEFIKEKKVMNGLISLLTVTTIVFALNLVLIFIKEINNSVLNYLSVIQPSLDIFMQLLNYLQYIILAAFVIIALKSYKK